MLSHVRPCGGSLTETNRTMGGSMSLKEKINSEMVAAAKAKDSIKLGAIRMIKTSLHNKEIDARRELKEEEILQVLDAQEDKISNL